MLTDTYSIDAIESLQNFAEDISNDFHWSDETLTFLTAQIWEDSFGFVRMGIAAELVRSRKLWNQSKLYTDWKDYCLKALKKTSWSIDRTIDASKVVMRLIEFGHSVLPSCEAQCRPMVSMMRNMCEGLSEAWQSVTDELSPAKITAMGIDNIINPDREPKPETIGKGTMKRLSNLAKQRGLTVEELVQELLDCSEEPIELEPLPRNPSPTPDDFEQIMSDLDLKFAVQTPDKPKPPNPSPSPIPRLTKLGGAFDDLMNDLVGKFIPKPSPNSEPQARNSRSKPIVQPA